MAARQVLHNTRTITIELKISKKLLTFWEKPNMDQKISGD